VNRTHASTLHDKARLLLKYFEHKGFYLWDISSKQGRGEALAEDTEDHDAKKPKPKIRDKNIDPVVVISWKRVLLRLGKRLEAELSTNCVTLEIRDLPFLRSMSTLTLG
jgi:hypothetical protein